VGYVADCSRFSQVNPQLKGHLRGAVNNGATVEEVKAVRDVAIRICEAAGMKTIGEMVVGGWGWRGEIANL
jgi:alkylhydroperoxidase/carboxymuconolactone decarboxylase family protein YurZ